MILFNKSLLIFSLAIFGLFFIISNASADIFTGMEVETASSTPTTTLDIIETEPVVPMYTFTDPIDALELQRLYLDADTIIKGYTVTSAEEDFKAGIMPSAVSVPVTVVLKKIPGWHMPVEKTLEKVSLIYEYDIRECIVAKEKCRDKGPIFFENTSSLGELDTEIVIAIKFAGDNYKKRVIHYWNKPSQEWVPIETTTDFDNNLVRAKIQFPYARIAVFEDINAQEGMASWYAFRDCYCAASHIYKRGSKLKVTNISGSVRHGNYIVVTVNDYGPDPNIHPDRPIDLDKVAYSALAASLGSGLMMVRVEPVNINQAEIYEWVDLKINKITQD